MTGGCGDGLLECTNRQGGIHVRLPNICGEDRLLVRQLFKALYGHPKAGQLWNKVFVKFLIGKGFQQSSKDKCLFFNLSLFIFLVLYVDDLLAVASSSAVLQAFWEKLSSTFEIRDVWGFQSCSCPSSNGGEL